MTHIDRRSFVYSLGALALLPWDRIEPELVLYNGNFLTMEASMSCLQSRGSGITLALGVGCLGPQ
jgi:hypothetical protein